MKASIIKKLELLQKRYYELQELLSKAEVVADQAKFTELSKEYSDLEPVVMTFSKYMDNRQSIADHKTLLDDDDPELRAIAQEELDADLISQQELEQELNIMLLPVDPNDEANIFLEIRAGAGGDEASIFAGDLSRMYARYAELHNWRVETICSSLGDHGGYKSLTLRLIGKGAYSKLKFESGVHRVQRVPLTESQGRVHTSTCTVAILPELAAIESVAIDSKDLKIDTYRSSGAGGQHVNTTDSAVRITHIPTGVIVECQDERSQHKNKAKAMSLLQTKILSSQQRQQRQQQADMRRDLVGSGDRSERIRTYNYPQGRVTDHRINLTLYKLPEIMEGSLEEVIDSLRREHQADLLASAVESA